jgi:Etoposide-induced protein 2.4 (EI24)
MKDLFDAFWRALAYALHPAVLLGSLLPLTLAGGTVFVLGWLWWEDAVAAVRSSLEQWELVAALLAWLQAVGAGGLRSAIAPLIVVALALPMVVVLCLLLVAWLMTPALVRRVVARRFPALEAMGGSTAWLHGVAWSIGCALAALLALVATLPLWLVPPLALLLPTLIWGWLAAQVLGFAVLAQHATPGERRQIQRESRWLLLAIGMAAGLLGALPSLVWVFTGVATLIFAPIVMVAAVWLYTLVFAFSTLWFAHFALARLQALRAGAVSSAS